MKKRAQGLSINVIIIVAIALIVLVVLVAVFTGRFGTFVGGVERAGGCNEICVGLGYDGGEITSGTATTTPGAVTKEGDSCTCTNT